MGNEGMLTKIVRSNWHLVSLLVLIVVSASVMAFRPKSADTAEAMTADTEVAVDLNGDGASRPSRWAEPTRDQRLKNEIEHYETELRTNHESSETPANLYRLANLYYSNLQDYDKASLYYESLIQQFPDYPGLKTVYPNLVVCYERLGKHDLKRNTYRRMMEYFGPDSQEYLWAKQALGL